MSIGEALTKAHEILKSVNIDTYILDSQLILQKVLKKDKLFIMINRNFNMKKEEEEEYFRLIELRRCKMPVKYILGKCEFMGLTFNIKEGVLIPRCDTEILVEEVIKRIKENGYKEICDVCCGSGAIGISIGKFLENTSVYCCDISDIACEVTKENIDKLQVGHNVSVFKSDLLNEAINNNRRFDVIVSNPPYIRNDVIPTLMDDVKKYEPLLALSGGEDGLDFYKKITMQSLYVLKKGGMLAFEIGYDQKNDVESILIDNGYKNIECFKDLAGMDRVVIGYVDNDI